MYFDSQECRVCGAGVEIQSHESAKPRMGKDPDGSVDVRVCTNPECPTNKEPQAEGAARP